jgi:hypothetical protein
MRLGFDLSYPFARHGELFISARHEIVSAFVWIPPVAAGEGYSEVDANTLRGRYNYRRPYSFIFFCSEERDNPSARAARDTLP